MHHAEDQSEGWQSLGKHMRRMRWSATSQASELMTVPAQSISLSKLAGLMDMDETSLRSQLMLLKQVRPAANRTLQHAIRCRPRHRSHCIHMCQPGQTGERTDDHEDRLLL